MRNEFKNINTRKRNKFWKEIFSIASIVCFISEAYCMREDIPRIEEHALTIDDTQHPGWEVFFRKTHVSAQLSVPRVADSYGKTICTKILTLGGTNLMSALNLNKDSTGNVLCYHLSGNKFILLYSGNLKNTADKICDNVAFSDNHENY
jgi:hypothetical protein